MDKIQKVLIEAGRKDLAQKYYKKVSKLKGILKVVKDNTVRDDNMFFVPAATILYPKVLKSGYKFYGATNKTGYMFVVDYSAILDHLETGNVVQA